MAYPARVWLLKLPKSRVCGLIIIGFPGRIARGLRPLVLRYAPDRRRAARQRPSRRGAGLSNRLVLCRRFEQVATIYRGLSAVLGPIIIGSPGRIRTADQRINSPSLYH